MEEEQNDLRMPTEGREDRDRARRVRVSEILSEGGMTERVDYLLAAIIFQRGEDLNAVKNRLVNL
jgi:hypothetical protein